MYPIPDWKRNLQRTVSNAELQIFHELNMKNLMPVTQQQFCLLSTKPDFYFPNENIAVYIDGEQVHKHPERDEELRRLLKKRYGCRILVYRYKAPITKTRLKEIVDNIVDNVKGQQKEWR